MEDELAKSLKADEHEPSTTHNCESSRAPKKSTKLLKQHLTSERKTEKKKAPRNTVQIPSATTSSEQLRIRLCTLLHSAWLADPTMRAGQRRPQEPSSPSRRKKQQYTESTQSCRRTGIRCRARHCAEEHHAADLPLHNASTSTQSMYCTPTSNDSCRCTTTAHRELVQELELLKNHGVDELNLGHLHSYPSQGGCHWECCKSRFCQYEPSTVSKRTHAWS